MQFTSSVGFSTNETPITLEWAKENFEVSSQGILIKTFLINRQADCFLAWNMDNFGNVCGNEWWQLHLHHAVFDIEYIEELEWICKSFGVKTLKESEMTLITSIDLKTKTPITQERIKKKYQPKAQAGTLSRNIGTIEYHIDTDLKLWVGFKTKFEEEENIVYIYCSDCKSKLEVKYMEQIEWVINRLKQIKSWKN